MDPIRQKTINSEVFKASSPKLENFVSADDQCCIEIGRDGSSVEYNYRSMEIGTVGFHTWFDPTIANARSSNQKGDTTSQKLLRLCICPHNVDMKAKLPPLWGEMWQELKYLNLKDSYLSEEEVPVPPSWFEVPLSGNLKGFIIKPEKWDANLAYFSIALMFSPSTGITCALLHILLRTELKKTLDRLKSLEQIAWHPLLLPIILLEVKIETLAPDLLKIRSALYKVEKDSGTHKNYKDREHHRKAGYYATGPAVWKREGFDSMPGILTSIASDCALFDARCHINEELLDWIEQMNTKLCLNVSDSNTNDKYPSSNLISRKISIMRTWLKNNRIRSVYLGHRAEIQVQACLSFMAQRDNDSSIQTAKAALRDSSDMRTIAIVTLVFLPATAASTFFSTTFFNFQKENTVVSAWIWLYCVVSLGLTTVAFAGWFWSRKEKAKKIQVA